MATASQLSNHIPSNQEEPPSTSIKSKGKVTSSVSATTENKRTQWKTKSEKYERFYDYINPMTLLQQGLYKYKEESDRKVLHILTKKLEEKFGEGAKFKDERSVLKYVYLIEDGETLSSIQISKEDLYEPNKTHDEIPDIDDSSTKSPDDTRKRNANRPHVGASRSDSVTKAPTLEYTCKVCMDQAVSITFIPCGHLVVCGACAPALGDCPVCRQTVKGTISTKF